MADNLFKSETKEEYKKSADEYFGHVESPKRIGDSADSHSIYDRNLPSKEAEYKIAERYTTGFDKAKRSGAFSKPNLSAAIFPSGLKFASTFIDEMTPGKYKKPPAPFELNKPQEQTKQVDAPKPAAIITERCMDCMELVDYSVDKPDVIINLGFITQSNNTMLTAMGMQFGDPFCSVFHATCMEKVKNFRKLTTPLVMGGALLSIKDRDLLAKYKGILQLHDGREISTGQWMALKRLEKTAQNTQDYIIAQRKKGDNTIFRDDRKI